MPLSRDQILVNRRELPRQEIDVPELGGSVLIRTLMLREISEIQKAQKANKDNSLKIYPLLLAIACITEDGKPLFVGDDVKLIDELPWPAVESIGEAIMDLNKMKKTDGDKDDPKESSTA